jgi:AcrR family transcriptional regulator
VGSGKRSYDARRRRERAEQERRATRRLVLDAARRLFVARGYVGTTMHDIADEAGVALQSVYNAGRSKADLLHMVVDLEVAGDDDEVMFSERPTFRAIGEPSEPRRQVATVAELIATTQERSASVQFAYRQAAAVDSTVAEHLDADLDRRHDVFTAAIAMIAREHLRHPPDVSADIAWAVGSSEVFLLLRSRRGWSADQYLDWLTATLEDLLLIRPTGSAPAAPDGPFAAADGDALET